MQHCGVSFKRMMLCKMLTLALLSHTLAYKDFVTHNYNYCTFTKEYVQIIFSGLKFGTTYDTHFQVRYFEYFIETVFNYVSFEENFYVVLNLQMVLNHQLPFCSKVKDIEEPKVFNNPGALLISEWLSGRMKLGIFHKTNFTTNIKLDNSKVCSMFFYETYQKCFPGIKTSKHYLPKSNLRRICKLRVAWVRAYPFVDNIQTLTNPGIMVSLLNIYAAKRDIEVQFLKNNEYQEEFLNNGTFFTLHRHLLERRFDVAIGPLFMNSTEENPFSYGPVFFKDLYYISVRRERITSYRKLTIVFSFDIWKGFLVTFFLTTISYCIFSFGVEPRGIDFTTAMFRVASQSLGYSVPILPISISLRLLFVCYSIFSIIMDSAYLGTLSSVFTNAPYDARITDPAAILRRGVSFNVNWFAERLCKIMFVGRRAFSGYSKKRVSFVNESDEDMLKRIAYSQENATFTLLSTLVSHPYEASLVDSFYVHTAYLTLFHTIYIRNDFHLKDSLLFWGNEIVEKGFVSKWMRDMIEQKRNGTKMPIEKKEAIPLKLQHFQETFQLLFFGYVLAAAFLVLEFIYIRLDRRFLLTANIRYVFSLLIPPPMDE